MTKYKGWDYRELFDSPVTKANGCPKPFADDDDDAQVNGLDAELLSAWLKEVMWEEDVRDEVAAEVRRFVEAIAAEVTEPLASLWEGLKRVEDDFGFLQAFALLVPIAWN